MSRCVRSLSSAMITGSLLILATGFAQTETPASPDPPASAGLGAAPAAELVKPAADSSSEPLKSTQPEFDEIVVKGVKLQGHIISFNDTSLTFETIYGKGQIEVQFTDLTQITTHSSYRFIQRDGSSVRGRVAQISSRDMVIASTKGDVAILKPENIERVVADVETSKTFVNRLRNRFPFTTVK